MNHGPHRLGYSEDDHEHGLVFWSTALAGAGLCTYGIWGLFSESAFTQPSSFARWFVGGALVHDALVAPLAAAIGVVLLRVAGRHRLAVRSALFMTAVVTAVAWAPLRGYGRRPGNPSINQPL